VHQFRTQSHPPGLGNGVLEAGGLGVDHGVVRLVGVRQVGEHPAQPHGTLGLGPGQILEGVPEFERRDTVAPQAGVDLEGDGRR
jgi:hypothetical protein